MTSESVDWQAAMQVEQYKATQVNSTMQAIAAVPFFDGKSIDLEFFIRSMDLIVLQVNKHPLDETTNNYILGYFYSRISPLVLGEIGATFETPWDLVKQGLREKYGGLGRTIPRTIVREVLKPRTEGQDVTEYAKGVLSGVRKVKARLKDAYPQGNEAVIRGAMLEELAQEIVQQSLPRRIKQWVRIVKPVDLLALVKCIEDEEREEQEERHREPGRRPTREARNGTWRRAFRAPEEPWRIVEARRRPSDRQRRTVEPTQAIRRRPEAAEEYRRRRPILCYECRGEGHIARECPYMYRRDARRQAYPEPMEVNYSRRRSGRWESSGRESDSDGSEVGLPPRADPQEAWPALRKKPVEGDGGKVKEVEA